MATAKTSFTPDDFNNLSMLSHLHLKEREASDASSKFMSAIDSDGRNSNANLLAESLRAAEHWCKSIYDMARFLQLFSESAPARLWLKE